MKDLENPLDKLDAEIRALVKMRIEEASSAHPELSVSTPLPFQGTNSVVFAAQWDGSPAVVKVSIRNQAQDEAEWLLRLEQLGLYPHLLAYIPPDILVLEQIDGIPWTVALRAKDETHLEAAIAAFIHLTEAIEEEPSPPPACITQSIQGTLLTVDELFRYHPSIYALPEIERAYQDIQAVVHRLLQEPSTWYVNDPGPDNLLVSKRGFERFVDAHVLPGNRVVQVSVFLERLAHRTNSSTLFNMALKTLIDHFSLQPDIVLAAALLRPLIAISRWHRWNGWNMWPDRQQLLAPELEEQERAQYAVRSISMIRQYFTSNSRT
jgi:hypothetical protein